MYIPLQRVVISLPSTSNPEEIRHTVMIGQPDVATAVMPETTLDWRVQSHFVTSVISAFLFVIPAFLSSIPRAVLLLIVKSFCSRV